MWIGERRAAALDSRAPCCKRKPSTALTWNRRSDGKISAHRIARPVRQRRLAVLRGAGSGSRQARQRGDGFSGAERRPAGAEGLEILDRSEEHTSELQSRL